MLEHERDGVGVGELEARGGVDTRPAGDGRAAVERGDRDAQVGARQGLQGPLIGGVVADVDDRSRPEAFAQPIQRLALGGFDDGEVGDLLAADDGHGDVPGHLRDAGFDDGAGIGIEAAQVHSHPGRFELELRLGHHPRQGGHRLLQILQRCGGLSVEGVDRVDVGLGAVGADEVDLARQPRHRCEVAQGPAGDDGSVGVGQGGERTHADEADGQRVGVGGLLDDRGDGAVVVGGDEQLGSPGQSDDLCEQLGIKGAGGLGEVAERARGGGCGIPGVEQVERCGHGVLVVQVVRGRPAGKAHSV